tara:strand:+ start:95 stop:415 length:321 start_codon:yes stop_codon:yes gene_type:complete
MVPDPKITPRRTNKTRKQTRSKINEKHSQIEKIAGAIATMCPLKEPGLCARIIPSPTDPDYAILEIRIGIEDDMYAQVSSSRVNTVEGTLRAIAQAYKLTPPKRSD